jgi:hypothetical protein
MLFVPSANLVPTGCLECRNHAGSDVHEDGSSSDGDETFVRTKFRREVHKGHNHVDEHGNSPETDRLENVGDALAARDGHHDVGGALGIVEVGG